MKGARVGAGAAADAGAGYIERRGVATMTWRDPFIPISLFKVDSVTTEVLKVYSPRRLNSCSLLPHDTDTSCASSSLTSNANELVSMTISLPTGNAISLRLFVTKAREAQRKCGDFWCR